MATGSRSASSYSDGRATAFCTNSDGGEKLRVSSERFWIPVSAASDISAPASWAPARGEMVTLTVSRSEEHTSELQSRGHLVCRLLLEKKKQRRSATKRRGHKKKSEDVESYITFIDR